MSITRRLTGFEGDSPGSLGSLSVMPVGLIAVNNLAYGLEFLL